MPNKIYLVPETTILFRPAAAGSGVPLEMTSLAAGAASSQLDLGTSARAGLYVWRLSIVLATATLGSGRVELYASTGDGTYADGAFGSSAATFSSFDRLSNLIPLGGAQPDVSGSAQRLTASGLVFLPSRTVAMVVWNATGGNLSSTASHHVVSLTPVPDELQG